MFHTWNLNYKYKEYFHNGDEQFETNINLSELKKELNEWRDVRWKSENGNSIGTESRIFHKLIDHDSQIYFFCIATKWATWKTTLHTSA